MSFDIRNNKLIRSMEKKEKKEKSFCTKK